MGHVWEYFIDELLLFLGKIGFNIESVIYRGWYGSRTIDIPIRFLPQLCPDMTILASKYQK